MFNIFKFYYVNINIKTILLFIGDAIDNNITLDEIKSQYDKYDIKKNIHGDKSNILNSIFNSNELDFIDKNSIEIRFIDDIINRDDTIEIVKFKLLKHLNNVAFEDLYLYSNVNESKSRNVVYDKLTNNNRSILTKIKLLDFLSNIDKISEIEKLESKEGYTYEDFIELDVSYKYIKKSIGQKFSIVNNEVNYNINPFNVVNYDGILEKSVENIVTTNNKSLLFEYNLVSNIIYFSLFKDVYDYTYERLNIDTTIKIYFPYLYNQNITNLEQYNLEKDSRILASKQILESKSFNNNNHIIRLFNNLSNGIDLKYNKLGIRYIQFNIHPDNPFNFPLDIIFKVINSSNSIQLIKFNPGKGQENVYRLYSPNKSLDGKKIPLLNKTIIMNLIKTMGIKKSVSMHLAYNYSIIIYEFTSEGSINVKIEFIHPQQLSDIQKIVIDTLNPIIKTIEENIPETNISFKKFNDIYDNNIEIVSINYFANINITSIINLQSIRSCISNYFNIINGDLKTGINMRYKRVSNYNEMDAIDSNIIELLKLNLKEIEIIENLIDNHKITEDTAKKKLVDTINSLELEQSIFENKKLKVKNNPGFLTTITRDKFKDNIEINVNNIDNINYLVFIPTIINNIIAISQKLLKNSDKLSKINSLCKNTSAPPDTLYSLLFLLSISNSTGKEDLFLSSNTLPGINLSLTVSLFISSTLFSSVSLSLSLSVSLSVSSSVSLSNKISNNPSSSSSTSLSLSNLISYLEPSSS